MKKKPGTRIIFMEFNMTKLFQEIKLDLDFIKSHTLQPKWYKVLKVFILFGFLTGYSLFQGMTKTAIFLALFLFLSLLVHMLYRINTHKWTRTWLDFVVAQDNVEGKTNRIGKFYYSAVILNAVLALIISQLIR
jgi:hypothetical protein